MMSRSWRSVVLAALLIVMAAALGAARPATAQAQAPPAAPDQPITTLVIFAPGVDEVPTSAPHDAYQRAEDKFQEVLRRLNCAPSAPSDSVLARCDNGIAWAPYSYSGVSGGHISPYTGAQTTQSLQESSHAMDEVVNLVTTLPETADAQLYVVAHSLGGSIATYWGADHPDVPIVTLDSPVHGIWPDNKSTLAIYCTESVGLLTSERDRQSCHLNIARFGLFFVFPAVKDLQDPANISWMGSANAFNIANTADIFVPSWYAINPDSAMGGMLVTDACAAPDDPSSMNHDCVFTAAAPAVSEYLLTGVPPTPTPIREMITLTITLSTGSGPFDSTVTVSSPGLPSTTVQSQNGIVTVTVPWYDWVVQASHEGTTISMGVLPAADANLTVSLTTGGG